MRPSFLDYLRQQAALPPEQRDPDPPEETPEQRAEREADLLARLDADIAETEAKGPKLPLQTHGTLHIPQCMLDAAGVEVMDHG